jgi:predicted transcriptional regulator
MTWQKKINELEKEAQKRGITQNMISERTGIQQPHVSRFFKAELCPRLDTYLKIRDAILKE